MNNFKTINAVNRCTLRVSVLTFFFLLLTVIACEKIPENPVYGRVYLRLDLKMKDKYINEKHFQVYSLNKPGIDYYPQQGEYIGLGGLVVVHTPFDSYCAFDLACPNEQAPNRNSIVTIIADGVIINAICSHCGTKYQLWDESGIAIEGKKFGLRRYNVSVSGYTGVVTN